ncbi:hypothetical protein GGS20DRAFT_564421 [Poronia punctata]|nr:hypothetical protein GGS20DRAFT_564421 [Poronia punctata]
MFFGKLKLSLKRRGQSSGSASNDETSPTLRPSEGSDTSNISSSSRFSWFRSSSQPKKLLTEKDPAYKRLNKPFTAQNLAQQKMFITVDWSSDVRRRRSVLSGISPCASVRASIDYGNEDPGADHPLPPDGEPLAPSPSQGVAGDESTQAITA